MTGAHPPAVAVRRAGDAALLVELAQVIDPDVNASAIAIARRIAALNLSGVRDVVPTYRSVAIHFDPGRTDAAALSDQVSVASRETGTVADGPLVEVPVVYGGEHGPDLGEVAEWAGVSPADVIARHTAGTYRVFMLGFLPGFAYMGTVDPTIAAPRRSTPRLRVPAGSVGIAGGQTGIYPMASPGGWQIIGRTSARLFDPARMPPALLAAGDRVRFVAANEFQDPEPSGEKGRTGDVDAVDAVTVLEPGLFTTVQDGGRWGHQQFGVPVSGAMDWVSCRLANRLVGNAEGVGLLEATLTGPALRFETETTVAVTGADLGASLDGRALRPGMSGHARPGSELRFGERKYGARAYVAFSGGIEVDLVLGSRATHVLSAMGGFGGRALRAGDRLPIGTTRQGPQLSGDEPRLRQTDWLSGESAPARVRVVPGPQDGRFPADALALLEEARFIVSPQSNRMGYRLTGAILPAPDGEMISDATFTGAVQVPPSGEPILLMADRQTTGGYAQLATIITADLPLAAQRAPGDPIEFAVCTPDEARTALSERERMLAQRG